MPFSASPLGGPAPSSSFLPINHTAAATSSIPGGIKLGNGSTAESVRTIAQHATPSYPQKTLSLRSIICFFSTIGNTIKNALKREVHPAAAARAQYHATENQYTTARAQYAKAHEQRRIAIAEYTTAIQNADKAEMDRQNAESVFLTTKEKQSQAQKQLEADPTSAKLQAAARTANVAYETARSAFADTGNSYDKAITLREKARAALIMAKTTAEKSAESADEAALNHFGKLSYGVVFLSKKHRNAP